MDFPGRPEFNAAGTTEICEDPSQERPNDRSGRRRDCSGGDQQDTLVPDQRDWLSAPNRLTVQIGSPPFSARSKRDFV
jgi:hypothetical protein